MPAERPAAPAPAAPPPDAAAGAPPPDGGALPRVVVVGGGIAGLAAALALRDRARVTVLEAAPRLGGKLLTSEFEGLPGVEEGAESFLVRAPEAAALARRVGLGDDLVHPAPVPAALWVGHRMRPLPTGTLLGVPTEVGPLLRSRVLTPAGAARAALDLVLPATRQAGDPAVGAYVRSRLGRQVVDRLVDPLLGGVYAGRADRLSLAATVPQLVGVAREDRSLVLGARRVRAAAPAVAGPVFASVRGGLGRLVAATAARGGADVRTGQAVRALVRRPGGGWTVHAGDRRQGWTFRADAVVLAVPAAAARRLLAEHVPAAEAALAEVPYASVALTTLVYRDARVPAGSGFLVPPSAGGVVKAATYLTNKWPHLAAAPDLAVVRASAGRAGDERVLQREDVELAGVVAAELASMTGLPGRPLASRVSRWGGGLPQYRPGHLDRVAALRRALPADLAVCGAAYDGVGIPACVRSGTAAAEAVAGALAPAR